MAIHPFPFFCKSHIKAPFARLDLDWPWVKRAKEQGLTLVINPDAHSPGELALVRYGVNVARRGWLEKKDVFNTLSESQISQALWQKAAK